jgi:hypothetical protein
MLIHKNVITALACATDPDHGGGASYARQIAIAPTGEVIATQGHILLRAAQGSCDTATDFPESSAGAPIEGCINAADLALMAKIAKTKKRYSPVLDNVAIVPTEHPGAVTLIAGTTRTTLTRTMTDAAPMADYPTWKNIFKSVQTNADGYVVVSLSAALLIRIAKAAQAMTGKPNTAVVFRVPKPGEGAQDICERGIAFAISGSRPAVDGVIMPRSMA